MSVLMLAPLCPWPVNSGSKVRMSHLARALSARHRVTFFSLRTSPAMTAYVQRSLPDVEFHAAAGPSYGRRPSAMLRALWQREPIHVAEAHSTDAMDELSRLRGSFDIVHVFHLTMVQYLPLVRARLRVFDPMGDESLYMERLSRTAPARWRPIVRWNLERVRQYETRAIARFDCVLSVSEIETPRFQRAARAGATVATVPIAPDTAELLKIAPSAGSDQLVLFGGSLDWFPNIDAAKFLAVEIWPLVHAKLPHARLCLAGKDPTDDVRRLGTLPGVAIEANPSSMVPLLQKASVVAVPIRTGSGIKIKTIEALAAGKAVVATGLGCEGWDVRDGVHLRRADGAPALAGAIVELLSNADMRRRLGRAAQDLVRERYTIDRMVQQVEEVYRTGLAAAGAA